MSPAPFTRSSVRLERTISNRSRPFTLGSALELGSHPAWSVWRSWRRGHERYRTAGRGAIGRCGRVERGDRGSGLLLSLTQQVNARTGISRTGHSVTFKSTNRSQLVGRRTGDTNHTRNPTLRNAGALLPSQIPLNRSRVPWHARYMAHRQVASPEAITRKALESMEAVCQPVCHVAHRESHGLASTRREVRCCA